MFRIAFVCSSLVLIATTTLSQIPRRDLMMTIADHPNAPMGRIDRLETRGGPSGPWTTSLYRGNHEFLGRIDAAEKVDGSIYVMSDTPTESTIYRDTTPFLGPPTVQPLLAPIPVYCTGILNPGWITSFQVDTSVPGSPSLVILGAYQQISWIERKPLGGAPSGRVTLPAGYTARDLAIDPATGTVYVSMDNRIGGQDEIRVMNPAFQLMHVIVPHGYNIEDVAWSNVPAGRADPLLFSGSDSIGGIIARVTSFGIATVQTRVPGLPISLTVDNVGDQYFLMVSTASTDLMHHQEGQSTSTTCLSIPGFPAPKAISWVGRTAVGSYELTPGNGLTGNASIQPPMIGDTTLNYTMPAAGGNLIALKYLSSFGISPSPYCGLGGGACISLDFGAGFFEYTLPNPMVPQQPVPWPMLESYHDLEFYAQFLAYNNLSGQYETSNVVSFNLGARPKE